mmetsp:Transcript_14051/g.15383  ORF Transcript_14051/g.15383 Transcript_14051/m.15383 type:complete len:80 (-) Transcript_14051:818-1057(-)
MHGRRKSKIVGNIHRIPDRTKYTATKDVNTGIITIIQRFTTKSKVKILDESWESTEKLSNTYTEKPTVSKSLQRIKGTW